MRGIPWGETYPEHEESKWTHLICVTDWNRRADEDGTGRIQKVTRNNYPHRPENVPQPCCWCGELTGAGIYLRSDPDLHEKQDIETVGGDPLLETAWGIIANALDWTKPERGEWREAAERWRDEYHKTLPAPSDAIESPR